MRAGCSFCVFSPCLPPQPHLLALPAVPDAYFSSSPDARAATLKWMPLGWWHDDSGANSQDSNTLRPGVQETVQYLRIMLDEHGGAEEVWGVGRGGAFAALLAALVASRPSNSQAPLDLNSVPEAGQLVSHSVSILRFRSRAVRGESVARLSNEGRGSAHDLSPVH